MSDPTRAAAAARPPLGWRRALTVGIAAAGAALLWALGLPLPFLFGPMLACLAYALVGAPLAGLGRVSVAARTILGVAIGASLTPEVVGQLPQMAASLALIPVYVGFIGLIGVPFFTRVCGFDRTTAYYAAMPGGLQDMVIFGTEAGGDVRALSLVHTMRLLVIVAVAPVLMLHVFHVELTRPVGQPAAEIPAVELALMAAAALVGWKGGERIGLFGAAILGPMAVTAALSLSGLIHLRPPAEAILTAQFLIGTSLGVGYVGVTPRELKRDVLSGLLFVVVLAALAAAFAEIVVAAGLAGPVEGFLAFAPGGQAEMTLLAIVAGADLGFVIVHHLTRVFLVITGAPLVAALLKRRGR